MEATAEAFAGQAPGAFALLVREFGMSGPKRQGTTVASTATQVAPNFQEWAADRARQTLEAS